MIEPVYKFSESVVDNIDLICLCWFCKVQSKLFQDWRAEVSNLPYLVNWKQDALWG